MCIDPTADSRQQTSATITVASRFGSLSPPVFALSVCLSVWCLSIKPTAPLLMSPSSTRPLTTSTRSSSQALSQLVTPSSLSLLVYSPPLSSSSSSPSHPFFVSSEPFSSLPIPSSHFSSSFLTHSSPPFSCRCANNSTLILLPILFFAQGHSSPFPCPDHPAQVNQPN